MAALDQGLVDGRHRLSARLRWLLLGDWTPVVRDPIDLFRLSFLGGAVATGLLGDWEQSLRLALTFAVTDVARLMDLPRPFDLAFNVGMGFQAWGTSSEPSKGSRATTRSSTSCFPRRWRR